LLREPCRGVETVDSEVRKLVRQMEETLREDPTRIGLAANQVGVLKRLFIYDAGQGPRCVINPELVSKEGEAPGGEGCLSIPGIMVEVPRFDRVSMRCRTLGGQTITIEAEGFLARMFQHECDHLDGVLIIDRCGEEERRRALAEYQEMELLKGQVGV